jgi:hypothetical protein
MNTTYQRKYIYEMPVYCGRMKEWRILNINTGSIYSVSYKTEAEAEKDIISGEIRANKEVKAISLAYIRSLLD